KKKVLGQVLIRWIGNQKMHHLVSTCATLPRQVYVSPERTHGLLLPLEEKGFGASAYKVDWKREDASSSKYLCYLTKSRMC
uniref:Uncharacterized protein n=1 Tax=Aegilops tauschii subsp. strangulata TaxID=200361 RepID=A0A453NDN1_AEGTS